VVTSLTLIYILIFFDLRNKSSMISDGERKKAISKRQKKVTFQAFLICLFLWWIAVAYAIAGFVKIPPEMGKFATMAIQACSGGWMSRVVWRFNLIPFEASPASSIWSSMRPSAMV